MTKSLKSIGVAFLWMGMMGCGAANVSLIPDHQSVASVGKGRKVLIKKFDDTRAANENFVPYADDPEHYVGVCFGNAFSAKRKLLSEDPPSVLIKNSIQEILGDAGFEMAKGDDPGAIEVRGTVDDFWINFNRALGFVKSEIGFHLVFLQNGKILKEKSFDSTVKGMPFMTSMNAVSKNQEYLDKDLNMFL